jgi:hypothetical protein
MLRPSDNIQKIALFTLFFGAIGDWVSTKLGIAFGHIEGNSIAAYLMNKGAWIQVDSMIICICFAIPFLLNHFLDREVPKKLFLFPLIAGILKLGVSIWNLSIIF